jgi:hypothetical protein
MGSTAAAGAIVEVRDGGGALALIRPMPVAMAGQVPMAGGIAGNIAPAIALTCAEGALRVANGQREARFTVCSRARLLAARG